MDTGAKSYLSALTAPFAKDAIGAQVPDMYSFPTSTQYVRCEFTLASDANGNVDFTLLPHIYASILCGLPNGATPNASSVIGGIQNSDFGPDNVANPANFSLNGVLAPNAVGTVFDQYRIVGWGARVRPLVAPLSQSGRLLFSSVPSSKEAFPFGLAIQLLAQTNPDAPANLVYTEVLDYLNLPSVDGTGFVSTEILNLPEAMECSYSDLSLKGGMEWVSKQVNTAPLDWNDSINNNRLSGKPPSDNLLISGLTAADTTTQLFVNREYTMTVQPTIGSPTLRFSTPAVNSSQTSYFGAPVGPPVGSTLDPTMCTALGVAPDTYIISVDQYYSNSANYTTGSNLITVSYNANTATTVGTILYLTPVSVYTLPVGMTTYDNDTPEVGFVLTPTSAAALGVPLGTFVISARIFYDNTSVATTGPLGTVTFPVFQIALSAATTLTLGAGSLISFYAPNSIFVPASGVPVPVNTTAVMEWQCNLSNNIELALDPNFNFYLSWIVPGPIRVSTQINGNNIDNGYDHSYLDQDGWSTLSCRGVGLPVSTQAVSVEVCYHLEGIQPISPITGAFIASAKRPYVNKAFMDAALEVAAQTPYFMKLQERPTQALAMLSLMNA